MHVTPIRSACVASFYVYADPDGGTKKNRRWIDALFHQTTLRQRQATTSAASFRVTDQVAIMSFSPVRTTVSSVSGRPLPVEETSFHTLRADEHEAYAQLSPAELRRTYDLHPLLLLHLVVIRLTPLAGQDDGRVPRPLGDDAR